MADSAMPEKFWQVVMPLRPPDQPVGPTGGHPRVLNSVVLPVIWYVLSTGIRWQDMLLSMGCSGRTAQRRVQEWQRLGIWGAIHELFLTLLHRDHKLDLEIAVVDSTFVPAPGGGEDTGPNPTDRRKTGTKHTLLVNGNGVPLALLTTGANVSDQQLLEPIIHEFPQVKGQPGRPKTHPEAAFDDRGYDSRANRLILRWLGIEPYIALRNTEHGSGLGVIRSVVERIIAWLKGFKRLRVRWDRLAEMQHAWNSLAMSIICFRLWID